MQNSRKQDDRNQAEIANNIYPIKQQVNAVTVNKHKWAWSVATGSSSVKLTLIALTECASKPVDANLDMYQRLLKISPEIATEFVLECRAKGIILDVEAGTVTRADANLKGATV